MGKPLERFLQCTDEVIEAYISSETDTKLTQARHAYNDSLELVNAAWSRLETQLVSASGRAQKAACAKAWIDAYNERKLFLRIESLLITIRDEATTAASTSSPRNARYALTHSRPDLYNSLSQWDGKAAQAALHRSLSAVSTRREAP